MANIEVAARKDFGQEFLPALQNIRAKYTYSHAHNDVSLRDILQEMAKADSVRTLKDAPAPGTANTVTTMLKKYAQWGTTIAATTMTTQNPPWVLPRTKTMNRWQQPPLADAGVKEKTAKKKTPTKKGRMMMAKRK